MHRGLQKAAGTVRLDPEEEYERKRRLLLRMREQGLDVEDRVFVEVGTGWHPLLPLVLGVLGARRTITLDVNAWLSRETLVETLEAVEGLVERLTVDFGIDAAAAHSRLAELRQLARSGHTPRDVLLAADVEYRFPVGAGATGMEAGSVDYVISSNVLEHIAPAELHRILEESRRILKPGGVSVHHVDPGDHFSIDDRITSVNFLKFSPRAWRLIGSGLAYHNRLRCVDYTRMFEELGFEILRTDIEVDEHALAALRDAEVRPHAAFAAYPPEELASALIDIFARYPGEAVVKGI